MTHHEAESFGPVSGARDPAEVSVIHAPAKTLTTSTPPQMEDDAGHDCGFQPWQEA